jgi:hypothetical protein
MSDNGSYMKARLAPKVGLLTHFFKANPIDNGREKVEGELGHNG